MPALYVGSSRVVGGDVAYVPAGASTPGTGGYRLEHKIGEGNQALVITIVTPQGEEGQIAVVYKEDASGEIIGALIVMNEGMASILTNLGMADAPAMICVSAPGTNEVLCLVLGFIDEMPIVNGVGGLSPAHARSAAKLTYDYNPLRRYLPLVSR